MPGGYCIVYLRFVAGLGVGGREGDELLGLGRHLMRFVIAFSQLIVKAWSLVDLPTVSFVEEFVGGIILVHHILDLILTKSLRFRCEI